MNTSRTSYLEKLTDTAYLRTWSRILYPGVPLVVFMVVPGLTPEPGVFGTLAWLSLPPVVFILLLAENIVATWRSRSHPIVLVSNATFLLVPTLVLSLFASGFVPVVAFAVCAAVLGGLSFRNDEAQAAWDASRAAYARRRDARGRHYRWRVFLAVLPLVIYVFAGVFFLAAALVSAAGTAMLAHPGGSPETAWIGAAFAFVVGLVTLAIALPVLAAIGGPFVGTIAGRPLVRLLRDLQDLPVRDGPGWISGFTLALIDLGCFGVGIVWLGGTLIGSSFPGGGSTFAYTGLVPLGLLIGARFVFADLRVLRSDDLDRTLLLKGVARAPFTVAAVIGAHTSLLTMVVLPVVVGALLVIAVALDTSLSGPGGEGPSPLMTGGALVVALIVSIAWMWIAAPFSLRLTLHRLTLLRTLAEPIPADATHPGELTPM